MIELLTITEDWIKQRIKMEENNLEDIRTLILQGNYDEKISYLGGSLLHFTRLKILDLSRNSIKSIKGIEHLIVLEVLNLYYNSIDSFDEIGRLQCNKNLKDLDLRLNPISRLATDYRIFLTSLLPNLKNLDCRAIREAERSAAVSTCPSLFLNFRDMCATSLAIQDTTRIKCNEFPINTKSKALMSTSYRLPEQEEYDDPSFIATNCIKMPNIDSYPSWIPSDNIRGLKHAEFYDRQERYLTEIEANKEEEKKFRANNKSCEVNKTKSISDLRIISPDAGKGHSQVKITEPRILPRGKHCTFPNNTCTSLCNGNAINSASYVKETGLKSRGTRELMSEEICLSQPEHNGRVDVEAERMDQSFFIMMKNLIHDAVSESFAKYNQDGYSRSKQQDSIPQVSKSTASSTYSNCSKPTSIMEPNREEVSNGHVIKPVSTDVVRQSAFRVPPRSLIEFKSSTVAKKTSDELLSPGLLKSENRRLLAEVERLKSQLKRYEQTEAEPHAWVVAEPTKVVSRIETAAICSTQNEFTLPSRTFRLWQPIRLDGGTNEDREACHPESDR